MLPEGAVCAVHVGAAARDTCARCGNFVCATCVEYEAGSSYCTTCLPFVSPARTPHSQRSVAALVMAILGISGCVPLSIVAVILGHLELGAIARGEAPRGGRNLALGAVIAGWIGVAGLVLIGLWVAIGAFALTRQ